MTNIITKESLEKLVPQLLLELDTYIRRPKEGFWAGQSVSSLLMKLLDLPMKGEINDIDVFKLDDFNDSDYKSDVNSEYKTLFINKNELSTIKESHRDGLLNEIKFQPNIPYYEKESLYNNILDNFDLNLVQVGIDLETQKLYASHNFIEFLNTSKITIGQINNPALILGRLTKKYFTETQGIKTNYVALSEILKTHFLLHHEKSPMIFGEKYKNIYEMYSDLLPSVKVFTYKSFQKSKNAWEKYFEDKDELKSKEKSFSSSPLFTIDVEKSQHPVQIFLLKNFTRWISSKNQDFIDYIFFKNFFKVFTYLDATQNFKEFDRIMSQQNEFSILKDIHKILHLPSLDYQINLSETEKVLLLCNIYTNFPYENSDVIKQKIEYYTSLSKFEQYCIHNSSNPAYWLNKDLSGPNRLLLIEDSSCFKKISFHSLVLNFENEFRQNPQDISLLIKNTINIFQKGVLSLSDFNQSVPAMLKLIGYISDVESRTVIFDFLYPSIRMSILPQKITEMCLENHIHSEHIRSLYESNSLPLLAVISEKTKNMNEQDQKYYLSWALEKTPISQLLTIPTFVLIGKLFCSQTIDTVIEYMKILPYESIQNIFKKLEKWDSSYVKVCHMNENSWEKFKLSMEIHACSTSEEKTIKQNNNNARKI